MTPKQKRIKQAQRRQFIKKVVPYFTTAIFIIILVGFLTGCARPGHEKGDTYKIMLGTKCAKNGTVQSPIWFHTTIGPDQVKKEWCQDAK